MKKSIKLFLMTVLSVAILAGCANKTENTGGNAGANPETDSGKLNIVATTTMLADLAKELGGDKVEVTGLMGAGIDPHLYQASAGDVERMQKADVVVYNGLHLEGKMGEVFEQLASQDKAIISIEEGLDHGKLLDAEDEPGLHDPHIWFDVMIWKDAAKYLAEELSAVDAANAETYKSNLESYSKELDELDSYIKNRAAEIPKESRVLVTAHDAFRYFGKAYDIEVRGLQGISTEAEAGTSDVSELADFIVDKKIKAIFVESSVPTKTVEALQASVKAKGFDVQIGGELYSDSLGDSGTDAGTYIGTLKANIDTIVDALK
ncbi:MAG: zinc ABC transporter substrate-binding protein [Peptostreptococcaceae bacterium]|nr:zinc ABC transporter substrate-binding protein [Peptostreptococcaceae bacterium]